MESKKEKALQNIESLKEHEKQAKKSIGGDRDQVLLDHIIEKDKLLKKPNHATSHLGESHEGNNLVFKNPVIEWTETDKFRFAFVMCPSWGILFPPYNIAKLTAILRKNGYSVKNYDINIESYHWFLENHGQDYWRSERYFLWELKENFEKYILPDLAPILEQVINDIVKSNVRVVGFSAYITNRYALLYMAKILRELIPDLCIIVGGPEVISSPNFFKEDAKGIFNYIFVGEAEETLLDVLEKLPTSLPLDEYIGSTASRLDLSQLPYPDYRDFDIKNYLHKGVSIETSRGCVAQCSFCAETYFWKFRNNTPENVVNEMEYQIKTYRIKRFWFVDSLINGNLKNFEQIIDLIREKKLQVNWNSYARCDGRMDFLFLRKAAAAGCTALSFGVESGSQKVLLDMRKKIYTWEIVNNLRDAHKANMYSHVNWLIGFPTEENIDFFHSLQMLYNIRKWAAAISFGVGTGLAKNSDIETNFKLYNIAGNEKIYDKTFLKEWYTNDYKNTILHRFLRVKLTHIWSQILRDYTGATMSNTQEYNDIKKFYSIEVGKYKNMEDFIEQDFHVNFNQCGNGFKDSIANEYIAFCYLLSKYFQKCKFNFYCDPTDDAETFGNFLCRNYSCQLTFEVNKNKKFKLDISHSLNNDEHPFAENISLSGFISDWQTTEPQIRETIHPQYKKK